MFFTVRLERGGPWDSSRALREQDGWEERARFVDSLVDEDIVVLGGPLERGREILHAILLRLKARLGNDWPTTTERRTAC